MILKKTYTLLLYIFDYSIEISIANVYIEKNTAL